MTIMSSIAAAARARDRAASITVKSADAAIGVCTGMMIFWDYDTQWGADRSRCGARPGAWGHLEFPCTDELLDLHAQFDVPACFAVVGAAALPGERPYHDPAQVRRIHAAGHEVASHAFHHEWLPALDRDALRRTLRDSKDALEQCIGAPVTSFVPPFNQPFDYAAGWSFSLAERREAGPHRTTLRVLCETLRDTGYRFCRVAYSPLSERLGAWLHPRAQAFTPGAPKAIAGITCVRVGPCGFDLDEVQALRSHRAADASATVALYGHPHSIHAFDADARTDAPQSIASVRRTLAAIARWTDEGTARCLTPRDLSRDLSCQR